MNIICFETEWLYNRHKKENRFNLNCQPILKCLKDRLFNLASLK